MRTKLQSSLILLLTVYICFGGIGCKCDGKNPVIEEVIPPCIDMSGGVVTLKGKKFFKIDLVDVEDATSTYRRISNQEIEITISSVSSDGDKYISIRTECGLDNKILTVAEDASITSVSRPETDACPEYASDDDPPMGSQCGGYEVIITGINLGSARVLVLPDSVLFYSERDVETEEDGTYTVSGTVAPHEPGDYTVVVLNGECGSDEFQFRYCQDECPDDIVSVNTTIDGGAQVVGIGDFDNDDNKDVVVAFYDSPTVTTFYGDGAGNFPRETSTSLNSSDRAVALTVADFNGDNRDDVAIATDGSYAVDILLSNSDGELELQSETYSLGAGPEGIALSHVNVDGHVDLAVPLSTSEVVYFTGTGTGVFTAGDVTSTTLDSPPTGITAGDPNADGLTDLYVPYPLTSSIAALFHEASADSFLISTHNNAVSNTPRAVDFHDVLSDYAGGEVLAVDPYATSGQLMILSEFVGGNASYTGTFSVGMYAGLVAGGYFGEGSAGQVAILVQNLEAPFLDIFPNPPDFGTCHGEALTGYPVSFAVGDLDEDGYEDIAIGLSGGTHFDLYLSSVSW